MNPRIHLWSKPKPFNWSNIQPIPITLINSSPDHGPPIPRRVRQVTHERIDDAEPITKLQSSGIHGQLRKLHRPKIFRWIFTT